MSTRILVLAAVLLVAGGLVLPGLVEACAVCYGAVDSPLTKGVNSGILVLLAVIAVVQVGFVALFLSIRQRAVKERRREESCRSIRGGAG